MAVIDGMAGGIKARPKRADVVTSRESISSGRNRLDAVLAMPAHAPVCGALLICHGIGETVEYWLAVQELLAAKGIASLVFDYSGYGRSTGLIGADQCELDAVLAFAYLQSRLPGQRVSLLGFSMGSGIAATIASRVDAAGVVLCAAYTSLREGACSICLPQWLAWLAPPIWRVGEALRDCRLPVLIVHGEMDRLFPVEMAEDLHARCGADAELVLIPGLGHNEVYTHPRMACWGPVLDHVNSGRSSGRWVRAGVVRRDSAIHLSEMTERENNV